MWQTPLNQSNLMNPSKKTLPLKMTESRITPSATHQWLSRLVVQEAHTEKTENLGHPLSLPPPQTHAIATLLLLRNNQKILWDQPLLPSHPPPPPPPQLSPQLQLAEQELEEQEVELHLVEVPLTQMLRTLEMPLMQPYIKQGLGLHLEEDLVVPEDLEDQEDPEKVCLRQSRLHTWFQS